MYTDNLFTLNNIPTLGTNLPVVGLNNIPALGCSGGGMYGMERCAAFSQLVFGAADTVFVNVAQFGRTLINAPMSGFASMEALLAAVGRRLSDVHGLVNVVIRNRTRGWTEKRTIRLGRPAHSMLAGA